MYQFRNRAFIGALSNNLNNPLSLLEEIQHDLAQDYKLVSLNTYLGHFHARNQLNMSHYLLTKELCTVSAH